MNIKINRISDIDIEYLENNKFIQNIEIINNDKTVEIYLYDEFIGIKRIISMIVNSINLKDEIEIYTAIFVLLSKILKYDSKVLYDNLDKIKKSSDLRCLISKKAICAGFVDVMEKILQEFGIKAFIKEVFQKKCTQLDKSFLNGNWYEDDITNNIIDLQGRRFPKSFLKCLDKKGNREFDKGWISQYKIYSGSTENLGKSIDDKEVFMLLEKFGIYKKIGFIKDKSEFNITEYDAIIKNNLK